MGKVSRRPGRATRKQRTGEMSVRTFSHDDGWKVLVAGPIACDPFNAEGIALVLETLDVSAGEVGDEGEVLFADGRGNMVLFDGDVGRESQVFASLASDLRDPASVVRTGIVVDLRGHGVHGIEPYRPGVQLASELAFAEAA
jgi:hypothetical protein